MTGLVTFTHCQFNLCYLCVCVIWIDFSLMLVRYLDVLLSFSLNIVSPCPLLLSCSHSLSALILLLSVMQTDSFLTSDTQTNCSTPNLSGVEQFLQKVLCDW